MSFIRRQSALPTLLAVIVPLLCFASIAIAIFSNDFSLPWDVMILQKIHATQCLELDAIAIALTQLGRSRVIIAIAFLIILFLVWRKNWQGARYLLITVASSGFVNLLAKLLFHRDRPSLWQSPISELSFSFPSGHAMLSMTLVVALTLLVPRNSWRSLFLFCGVMLAIAIGWTRLYLGVHYPSDILGGWALAIAWVMAISLLSRVNANL